MPRAVRFDSYGGPDVLYLADLPEPEPTSGRVVVAVAASSINPGEAAIRSGALHDRFPATFPSGQGSDFAGVVRAIGPGVAGWHVGDEVLGWTDERAAHADVVSVPSDQLTIRPPAVPVVQAACLHVAGITAWAMVDAAHVVEGETVVVFGAAGGVGCAVVQLLRRAGARVLAVAGPDNDDYLRSLGADPVNYGTGLGHRLRDAAPEGIAAALDAFGGGYVQLAVGMDVPAARVVTIIDADAAERLGARQVFGHEVTSAALLAELAELVADGDLEFPIAATYPLEQVREAFEALEERHTRGKIVLVP